jgi:hypothetical protein
VHQVGSHPLVQAHHALPAATEKTGLFFSLGKSPTRKLANLTENENQEIGSNQ